MSASPPQLRYARLVRKPLPQDRQHLSLGSLDKLPQNRSAQALEAYLYSSIRVGLFVAPSLGALPLSSLSLLKRFCDYSMSTVTSVNLTTEDSRYLTYPVFRPALKLCARFRSPLPTITCSPRITLVRFCPCRRHWAVLSRSAMAGPPL